MTWRPILLLALLGCIILIQSNTLSEMFMSYSSKQQGLSQHRQPFWALARSYEEDDMEQLVQHYFNKVLPYNGLPDRHVQILPRVSSLFSHHAPEEQLHYFNSIRPSESAGPRSTPSSLRGARSSFSSIHNTPTYATGIEVMVHNGLSKRGKIHDKLQRHKVKSNEKSIEDPNSHKRNLGVVPDFRTVAQHPS